MATGFSGNGITLGTFSATLIRDLIAEKANPWSDLFAPSRKSVKATLEYVRENKDFVANFVKDWLESAAPLEKLKRNTGGVFKVDGKKRAVFCNAQGKRTVLSPVCPHMGVSLPGMMPKRPGIVPATVLALQPAANLSPDRQNPA